MSEFIRSRLPLEPYRVWTTSPRLREVGLRVSVGCFALSVTLYVGSFFGLRGNGWLAILYFVGAFLAFGIADSRLVRNRETFCGYERWPFLAGVPAWIKLACLLLFAMTGVHFFLIASSGGSPEVVDGAYVLVRKGTGMQTISRANYLLVKAQEFRFALTLGGTIWFNAAACWWVQRRAGRMESGD